MYLHIYIYIYIYIDVRSTAADPYWVYWEIDCAYWNIGSLWNIGILKKIEYWNIIVIYFVDLY